MRVTQKFIDELSFKGGWKIETLNTKSFYVLTDPVYCQVFWIQYWNSIGVKAFSSQRHITFLNSGDLRTKVILDPTNGDLLMGPESWNLIYYLGNIQETKQPIIFYVSPVVIITIYIIFCIVIIILYYIFANEYTRPF